MKKESENKDATKGAEDKSEKPHDAEREAEREALEARIAELEAENESLRAENETNVSLLADLEKRDSERGLNIKKREEHQGGLVQPGRRLYLNAKKNRLLPEGHKDAATLYCTQHSRVPRAEFERLSGK